MSLISSSKLASSGLSSHGAQQRSLTILQKYVRFAGGLEESRLSRAWGLTGDNHVVHVTIDDASRQEVVDALILDAPVCS